MTEEDAFRLYRQACKRTQDELLTRESFEGCTWIKKGDGYYRMNERGYFLNVTPSRVWVSKE